MNRTIVLLLIKSLSPRRHRGYQAGRRPLGRGLVAWLHRCRHHHSHFCYSFLVPAEVIANACGETRLQLQCGQHPLHQGLSQPEAQVQAGGAAKPAADGQRYDRLQPIVFAQS